MHIKEISLDGFKSYAQRVVVPGFDPQARLRRRSAAHQWAACIM